MRSDAERPWPELPPPAKSGYRRLRERLDTPGNRRLRRLATRSLLALVGLAVAAGAVLYATRTYRLDSATYPGTVRRLVVDAGPGSVAAVGSDRGDLLAFWQRRYSLIAPAVERSQRGPTLQLRSHCPRVSFRCAVILGSQIPEGTAVTVSSDSAPVSVSVVRAPVEVATRSGDVTLDHVQAPVRVDTASGKLVLSDLRGSLVARAGSAPVELHDVNGPIDLASGAGSITGTGWVSASFVARTGSGWVTTAFDAPPERVDVRSDSGQVTMRLPAGRYRLQLQAPAAAIHLSGIVDDPGSDRIIKISTHGGIVLTGTGG